MTTSSFLPYVLGGLCFVLIGMNAAVVYRFWPEPWLTGKLVAVSGLLSYILLFIRYGHPSLPFLVGGLVVAVADVFALFILAGAMYGARKGDGVLIAYRRR